MCMIMHANHINKYAEGGGIMTLLRGLSWECHDFIMKCVCWDPAKRMSIEEALVKFVYFIKLLPSLIFSFITLSTF